MEWKEDWDVKTKKKILISKVNIDKSVVALLSLRLLQPSAASMLCFA